MSFALDKYAVYVWSCYGLFLAALLWDFMVPRLRLRRVRRETLKRLRREAARKETSA